MQVKTDLPKNWKWVKLGDHAFVTKLAGFEYTKHVSYKDDGDIPVIKAQNVTRNGFIDKKLTYVDRAVMEKLPRSRVYGGEVLMVFVGSVGNVAIVPTNKQYFLGPNVAKIAVEKEFYNKYIFYFLSSATGLKKVAALSKATTQGSISMGNIRDVDVPFTSIHNQQKIVSKIEELFSELDKGIEEIKTAQQQLKVYRQAVLKWAFEGKITHEVKEGELPKGWKRVRLEEACIIKRGKSKHRPRNDRSLYGGKYPFIQTGDIRNANGGTITAYTQTYSELGLQQSKLWKKGTLCITIAANIGETAILNFDACFPDSVVGLVCNEDILLTRYTNYFFISYKSRLEEMAPATAQKNINVEILERVEIPIGSIEEQQQIVQEIESRLSVCDKIEETITNSLKQAEALRQSILKKAFEGKLV